MHGFLIPKGTLTLSVEYIDIISDHYHALDYKQQTLKMTLTIMILLLHYMIQYVVLHDKILVIKLPFSFPFFSHYFQHVTFSH